MQYRKKIYSDERKQGQVKNYLKEIQLKAETLRNELIENADREIVRLTDEYTK